MDDQGLTRLGRRICDKARPLTNRNLMQY